MSKLSEVSAVGNAGNGLIKLKLDGNYKLKEFHLATELHMMEKDDLEDYLAIALENAIDQITEIREKELMHSLVNLMPPGSKG